MERHGFGGKTFQIETDATGKAVVYCVNGQSPDAYYEKDWNTVGDEISKKFDLSQNFYLVSIETNNETFCGLAAAHGSMGGIIFIPSSGPCFLGTGTTVHELGHVFGLDHDFRNDIYHMSYGEDLEKNQFSQCAAKWLDAHRAFNPVQTAVDEPSTIKMLPPTFVFSSNAIRLCFEVTDPDGLHQAQLKTDKIKNEDPAPEYPKLIDCKSLSGKNSTVEFVTALLTPKNNLVYLAVMDVHGNFVQREFSINVPVQRRPSTSGKKSETAGKISDLSGIKATIGPFISNVVDHNYVEIKEKIGRGQHDQLSRSLGALIHLPFWCHNFGKFRGALALSGGLAVGSISTTDGKLTLGPVPVTLGGSLLFAGPTSDSLLSITGGAILKPVNRLNDYCVGDPYPSNPQTLTTPVNKFGWFCAVTFSYSLFDQLGFKSNTATEE